MMTTEVMTAQTPQSVTVSATELVAAALQALQPLMLLPHAEQQVDLLIEADLRGVASHGMLRLPRIVRRIRSGAADPLATGHHHWRAPAFLEVDGARGLGPVVANAAIAALGPRARASGVALAAIRDANHLGMLGYYAERAAAQGFTMLALTTSEALVHPWGGRRAMIGTNPIAIALPTDDKGGVFMMDTATSLVSMGEIHDHANRGAPLPPGWALDAKGRATTDAEAAKAGAIAPFGGPKGYALGLAIELMVAGLARAAIGRDVAGTLDDSQPCNKGDLFVLIDGPLPALEPYLAAIRAEDPAEGFAQVLIPGERGRASRDRRRQEGITLPAPLWQEIQALGA